MIDGVFLVSTAGHGGVMVRKNAAGFLSPEARSIALNERNYLCFEEDCDEAVVMRELLDKKLWVLPDRIADKAGYEDAIDRSLMQWHPGYWEYRQNRIAVQGGHDDGTEPEMTDARRDIIFRDADYKEKFRIKDGESIKIIVAYDGEELIRKCRWIDEAHMDVGSTPFHMDEFMEKAARVGNKYEPIPGQEPKLDVLIAEPGKPPRDAEIPMRHAAIREIIGGEPEIVSEGKFSATIKGVNGNGAILVCGINGSELTSLHPYVAQTQKRELAARVAEEKATTTLTSRLEAGKTKAAAYIPVTEKTAPQKRRAEMGVH